MLRNIIVRLKINLPVILILFFSSIVYIWDLWKEGFSNLYYSAGVYSMGQNLHAFFYNSLDSVGFISIDKPPLGLWIQVLFTKILGFHGVVILLPEAISGVLSVFIIYKIIDKRFSRAAAIASALVLSCTPILAAVCRNNTIDGILIFLLVLASWQVIVATEKSSLKHLIYASIFIALGFNVKSFQAYMIIPAVYLTYLLFSSKKTIKKWMDCLISGVILLLISFSWILAVDFTPPQYRPYVGSSGTNSELALTFGNNGMGRLIGGDYKNQNGNPKPNIPDGNNSNKNTPRNKPLVKKVGGESGPISVFRLYILNNAGQISWFLFPALITSLMSLFLFCTKKFKTDQKSIPFFYFSMCFLPMFFYFNFSNGVVHRYYFAMLAFPIAALTGIGLFFVMQFGKYRKFIIPTVFLITAGLQLYIQNLYKGWIEWMLPFCTVLFVIVTILLIISVLYRFNKIFITSLFSVLLIMPGIWSFTPIIYGNNAQLPITGPELVRQGDAFDHHPDLSNLIQYLITNRGDAAYLAVVPSAMSLGAELILQSGGPVMVLGGFNGGDNPLSIDGFKEMIEQGKIKYALISNDMAGNAPKQSSILSWIIQNGIQVNQDVNGITLYQLSVNKLV